MNEKEKRLVKINTEKSVSNWFTMLPVTEHGSNHQSSSSGIQLGYVMVGKSQI